MAEKSSTARRGFLRAAVLSVGAAAVAAAPARAEPTDPVLDLIIRHDQVRKERAAAQDDLDAIMVKLPRWVRCGPMIDLNHPAFQHSSFSQHGRPISWAEIVEYNEQVARQPTWGSPDMQAKQREQRAARAQARLDWHAAELRKVDAALDQSGYTTADERIEALEAERYALDEQITRTQARTMAGLLAKLHYVERELRIHHEAVGDEDCFELRALTGAVGDLERLTGSATSAPKS